MRAARRSADREHRCAGRIEVDAARAPLIRWSLTRRIFLLKTRTFSRLEGEGGDASALHFGSQARPGAAPSNSCV